MASRRRRREWAREADKNPTLPQRVDLARTTQKEKSPFRQLWGFDLMMLFLLLTQLRSPFVYKVSFALKLLFNSSVFV